MMTQEKCHFMVVPVLLSGLEDFLNHIEDLASGCYHIVSIIPMDYQSSVQRLQVVGVVVKFTIMDDDDIEFNEEVIRRLGF